MRLRTRLSTELKARLMVSLPEAIATVWDHAAVLVVIEQLKFTPAGGVMNDWALLTQFEGIVRAELRADGLDSFVVEPLIANLVADPVFLDFDPTVQVDQLSERARAVLVDWRDTVRDQHVASALRFTVSGTLAAYAGPFNRPQLLASAAPEIGANHESSYAPVIGGDA